MMVIGRNESARKLQATDESYAIMESFEELSTVKRQTEYQDLAKSTLRSLRPGKNMKKNFKLAPGRYEPGTYLYSDHRPLALKLSRRDP